MLEADLVAVLVTDVTDRRDRARSSPLRNCCGSAARTGMLVAVNKVDDEGREPLIWEFVTLGLGDPRIPSARCTGAAAPTCSTPSWPSLPEDGDARRGGRRRGGHPSRTTMPSPCPWRSWGGPTSASPRCSTASSGRSARWCTTCPAPPGTPLTHWSRPTAGAAAPRRHGRPAAPQPHRRPNTEYYAMLRALRSVDRADVVLLMVDSTQGITHQDQRLAERIDGAGCPILLLLNKWDLLEGHRAAARHPRAGDLGAGWGSSAARRRWGFPPHTGRGVNADPGRIAGGNRRAVPERRIPTRAVNRAIREAQAAHPAPGGARVLYATQGASDPPTFTLFVNRRLPATYLRYLQRRTRRDVRPGRRAGEVPRALALNPAACSAPGSVQSTAPGTRISPLDSGFRPPPERRSRRSVA